MANRNANLWKTYGGKGFAAEYSEYSERASADVNGNSLEVGIEGDEVTGIGSLPLHAAKADTDANGNSLSLGLDAEDKIVSIGGKEIAGTGGSGLIPPEKESILGGGNGSYSWKEIGTEEVTGGSLLTTYDGMGLKAARAVGDADGNSISATYATKAELPTVNDAKLKLQLGSGQATDTGFTANASADVTLTVPEMTGATASTAGSSGIVPSPAAEDKDKFLKGDGTWDTPIFDKNYSSVWGDSPSGVYGMFHVTVGRDQYGYSGAPRTLTQVGRNDALGYLLPDPVEGTIPVGVKDAGNNKCYALKTLRQLGALTAKVDKVSGSTVYNLQITTQATAGIFSYSDEGGRSYSYWGVPYNGTTTGQVLTYNESSGPYWAMPANPLPTPTHDNELFVGMSDGSSSWKQLATVGGNSTQLLDENNDPILDETGEPIYDDEPILWKTLDDRGFYAERALADSDGQEIKTTYSTVAYTDSAISSLAQQVEAGYQRKLLYGSDYSHQLEYILIDGNWVPTYVDVVPNNAVTHITRAISNGEVLRCMCKVNDSAQESPNFAIELEPFTAGSASVTATVEVYIQPNGPKSAYLARHSMSCSTTVATDKYYQITCVGKCWTIAEFGTANA